MINLMPVIMLLLMIALPTIKATGRTPTAYVTSGGGFKTMTASMGIIRAWDESNILQLNTTHSGCVSGGCWFQFQFSYSKDFYESALGLNGDSVTTFLRQWGKRYGDAMKEGIKEEKFEKLDLSISNLSGKACLPFVDNIVMDAIDGVVNLLLDDVDFPLTNWYFYVEAMLGSYITNYNTSLFSAEREGFANSVIVAGSSLAIDAYANDPSKTLTISSGLPDKITLLPINFVASDGSTGEWQYTAAESPLEVSTGKGFFKKTVKFELLPAPLINVVAGAASSFAGAIGSPTILSKFVDNFLKNELQFLGSIELKDLNECLPLGLQDFGSPTEGNIPSTVSPWDPFYRYLDGGYTENSGIAHTIANMQQSCIDDPSKYDCSKGLRLLNICGHGIQNVIKNLAINGGDQSIPRLFANCNCGNSTADGAGKIFNVAKTVSPQIFSEDFPSDLNGPGWELYSTKTYDPFGDNTEPSISYAWRGNVTTVSNKAYGVTAGMNVDLVVIFTTLPSKDKIIKTGADSFAFSGIYGDVAEELYESTLALFKKWKLPEQWGTGVTTVSPTNSKGYEL